MTSELLKAEQAGEKVHILSHVPAGTLLPCFIFPCILFVLLVLYPFCPCISPLIVVRYIVWFNHCSNPKTYSTHMYLDYQMCSMTKLGKNREIGTEGSVWLPGDFLADTIFDIHFLHCDAFCFLVSLVYVRC